MRRLVFLLSALALGGSSRALEPRPVEPVERYREVFGPEVTLTWNATKSAPMALRGLQVPTEGVDPGERARRFALTHAEWLGLDGEVRVLKTNEVVLAGKTFRGVDLERTWHGLPVEGQGLHVRMDAEDRVRSVTSSLGPLAVEEPAHQLAADAAVRAIRDTYRVAAVGVPTKVVRAVGTAGRIAWRVPVAVIPLQAHFFVWVDAADGRILSERPAGADQPMRSIPLLRPEANP